MDKKYSDPVSAVWWVRDFLFYIKRKTNTPQIIEPPAVRSVGIGELCEQNNLGRPFVFSVKVKGVYNTLGVIAKGTFDLKTQVQVQTQVQKRTRAYDIGQFEFELEFALAL